MKWIVLLHKKNQWVLKAAKNIKLDCDGHVPTTNHRGEWHPDPLSYFHIVINLYFLFSSEDLIDIALIFHSNDTHVCYFFIKKSLVPKIVLVFNSFTCVPFAIHRSLFFYFYLIEYLSYFSYMCSISFNIDREIVWTPLSK